MRGRLIAIAIGMLLAAPAASQAAGPNQYSAPEWLPVRNAASVGCVLSNCSGPYHGYWAIDLVDPNHAAGDPIYAAGAGQAHIVSRSPNGACGGPGTVANVLEVNHASGVSTFYYHLHGFSVGEGAWVDQNTQIGVMGSTGYTDPCPTVHLHYEKRLNGTRIDPGPLKACHGSTLVTYPGAAGFSGWNSIPFLSRSVRSDGTACGGSDPLGAYDLASSPQPGTARVAGWSFDPDARTTPLAMHVYVGGQAGQSGAEGHAFTADGSRPDVAAVHPGVGNDHGLDVSFETGKRGSQPVCLYAINVGGGTNVLLGCKTVTIADPNPSGAFDEAGSPVGGRVRVRGWTFDPNTPAQPNEVHIYVGGPAGSPNAIGYAFTAGASRPDVGAAFPGVGDSHGFDQSFETSKRGSQPVCAYAIDAGPGDNVALGCKTVTIGEPPPPAPVTTDSPAAPAPPGSQLTPAAVAVRFKPSVRRGRALRLTCAGIADGTRLAVRWRPRHGRAIRRTVVVERGRASVRAPRKRGRYAVRVTLAGGLLKAAEVRVR